MLELSLMLRYRIASGMWLRAGYQYYCASGLALGPRQLGGLDANGTSLIGYGYTNSGNGQNRLIQEITFGFNQTMWKSPKYGALNFMGQWSHVHRNPWPYIGGTAAIGLLLGYILGRNRK